MEVIQMNNVSNHYFTDSTVQLELNLKNITRELILMIEEFEKQDCFVCLHLKCRCVSNGSPNSASNSDLSTTNNNDYNPTKSPPANCLPIPKFQEPNGVLNLTKKEVNKDIEAWFAAKTSTIKNDTANATEMLLATLKKSWDGSRVSDLRNDKMFLDPRYASTANAVEAFFKSFKVQPINMTPANIAYITNKLTTAYVKQKTKKEYSYF